MIYESVRSDICTTLVRTWIPAPTSPTCRADSYTVTLLNPRPASPTAVACERQTICQRFRAIAGRRRPSKRVTTCESSDASSDDADRKVREGSAGQSGSRHVCSSNHAGQAAVQSRATGGSSAASSRCPRPSPIRMPNLQKRVGTRIRRKTLQTTSANQSSAFSMTVNSQISPAQLYKDYLLAI